MDWNGTSERLDGSVNGAHYIRIKSNGGSKLIIQEGKIEKCDHNTLLYIYSFFFTLQKAGV